MIKYDVKLNNGVEAFGTTEKTLTACEHVENVDANLLDQSKSGLTLNAVVNVPYVQRTATTADPADTTGTNPGNQGNTPNPGSGDDGMS